MSEYMPCSATWSKGAFHAAALKQRNKLVDRYARLVHDCSQSSLGDFAMVGNNHRRNGGADVRRIM
jgi:hypothetical protein